MTATEPARTSSTPPAAGLVEVRNLSKSFGDFKAVDDLSFSVEPGHVTGFLGPNGAGKTTTLRMLLGLVRPTSGNATIGGRDYQHVDRPMQTVGSALEATNFHPGRSGRDHLRVLAAAGKVPDRRVDELLELVGIAAAGKKRAGGYSMGMRQRLGLAAALLGDPQVLILDEPANGLDPEGIRWLRGFLRHLASEGKTILISSHMLSEVEQTVDEIVIIANGRLIRQGRIDDLRGVPSSIVRTSDVDALGRELAGRGFTCRRSSNDELLVESADHRVIGDTALRLGLPVYGLAEHRSDLEELFFQLTSKPDNRNRNLGPADGSAAPQGGGH